MTRDPILPFYDAVRLERIGDDRWTGDMPADWAQGRASFGGLSTGVALTALREIMPADRQLRSLLTDFVAPVAPGKVEVEARVLRSGRAIAHGEVRLHSQGKLAGVLLAAYGLRRDSPLALAGQPRPQRLPPEEFPAFPYLEGITPAFTRAFSYRWTSDHLPFSGVDQASLHGWVRLRQADRIDERGVLALIDSWPAPVLPLMKAPAPASTVTWTVDLVGQVPADGWPGDGWFHFEGEALAAADGYATVQGRIWSPDGQLVATSRQLVAEFSR